MQETNETAVLRRSLHAQHYYTDEEREGAQPTMTGTRRRRGRRDGAFPNVEDGGHGVGAGSNEIASVRKKEREV